jgi:hypothetical protein
MSYSLSDIRAALSDTIRSAGIGVYSYATVKDKGHLPAAIVEPIEADFNGAFHRGLDTWWFNLYVLVRGADEEAAQRKLDSYVTGAGEHSIRELLFNNKNLGLGPTSGVEANVDSLKSYGGEFKWGGVEHIGAILKVRVVVSN